MRNWVTGKYDVPLACDVEGNDLSEAVSEAWGI